MEHINNKEELKLKISMLEKMIKELPDSTEKERQYVRDTHQALHYCLIKYLYLSQLENELEKEHTRKAIDEEKQAQLALYEELKRRK